MDPVGKPVTKTKTAWERHVQTFTTSVVSLFSYRISVAAVQVKDCQCPSLLLLQKSKQENPKEKGASVEHGEDLGSKQV